MNIYKSSLILPLLIVFFLSACGGGGSGGGSTPAGDTVEDTLTDLGIDIADTPREDTNGDPLPEDYTPLGSSKSFDQLDELVMIGFPLVASSGISSELTLLELNRDGTHATYTDEVLFSPDTADTPWALSVGAAPAALRVATRSDIDKDGLEELLVVFRAAGQDSVELQLYEDETESFAAGQNLVISTDAVDSLAVTSGDFNGDGYTELVIGLVSGNSAQLVFVDNNDGILSLSTLNKTLPQAYPGSEINLVIKSGNLDYDPSLELVVLVNERILETGNPESGTTRYFVFDDAKEDHVALSNALVQSTAVNRTAIVADVSLGDVDGDNIDEIVFAGLTHFDPAGTCSYNYLLIVLDDLAHDNESLGALEHQTTIHGGCATAKGELRFVHVNTPDLDGDGIPEIQANELIFDDFRLAAWAPLYDPYGTRAEIPHDSLFGNVSGFTGRFSQQNSTIVVADLTADKRQDIIFYSQSTNKLEVWGLSVLDTRPELDIQDKQWRMIKSIAIEPPASTDELRPILVPININHDGLAISLEQGSYQLVFTEPVLIAALAAAPCYDNLGQNTDACRTTYGTAESDTVALENTTTITAGVAVGANVEISDPITAITLAEISAKVKVSASLSLSHSASYTYTESVVYTTGPIEDTVIFTSIPYDIYTYTITSHPDPAVMGTDIVVSMPRSPVTLQVERSFYNASVAHGGPLIDSTVFSHSAGDPTSYPNSGAKDTTVNNYYSDPLITPSQWAYDFGPVSVGQGGGDTSLEINVATESGLGVAVGVEAEFELEVTTLGVLVGFSIGVSNETSLQISHGSESTYGGTVANLPSTEFAANGYDWGLFTYVMDDHASGQQFEVINFWVD